MITSMADGRIFFISSIIIGRPSHRPYSFNPGKRSKATLVVAVNAGSGNPVLNVPLFLSLFNSRTRAFLSHPLSALCALTVRKKDIYYEITEAAEFTAPNPVNPVNPA
jgi:hypothetical protein